METSLIGAVEWVRLVLLGALGMSTAALAVASIGLLMLSGRLPVRRGATVVVGCFVLFSAATIANGLVGAVVAPVHISADTVGIPQPIYAPTVPRSVPYDPYAGASVPVQREQPIIR